MKWKLEKLGDICAISSGGTPSRREPAYFEGTIPWAKISDIENANGYISETEEKITKEALSSINNRIFPPNTLLLAIYGSVGKVAITMVEMSTNQAILGIRPLSNSNIDLQYLKHWFSTIKEMLLDRAVGGTLQNISLGIVKELPIPLPPLATQQKIAAILDEADALRRKDKALLAKYDELLQAVFYDMFGDVDENTMGQRLGDVISINPKKSELNIAGDTLVSFVPMACVGEKGEFHPLDDKPMSEVKSGFTYFRNSDVLFAKITPCMENGKGAIARNLTNGIGFGSTEFHVLRPNKYLNAEFLYTYLSRPSFRKLAEKNMTGSAGQKRVSTDFLANLKLNIPDVNCQEKFAHIYTNIQQQKSQIIQQQTHSEQLFQSLMQRAFAGRLVG